MFKKVRVGERIVEEREKVEKERVEKIKEKK